MGKEQVWLTFQMYQQDLLQFIAHLNRKLLQHILASTCSHHKGAQMRLTFSEH